MNIVMLTPSPLGFFTWVIWVLSLDVGYKLSIILRYTALCSNPTHLEFVHGLLIKCNR